MQIFDKQLFGSDADWFCNTSFDEKKQWILENTNQRDENQIETFITSKLVNNDKDCVSCGKLDNKIHNPNDRNISKGNEQEVEAVDVDSSASGNSKRGTNKRRNNPKNA